MSQLLILEDRHRLPAIWAARALQEKHRIDVQFTDSPSEALKRIRSKKPPEHLLLDMMMKPEPAGRSEINLLLKRYVKTLKTFRMEGSPLYGEALSRYPSNDFPDSGQAYDMTLQLLEAGSSEPLVNYTMEQGAKVVCNTMLEGGKPNELLRRFFINLVELIKTPVSSIDQPYGAPLASEAYEKGLNVGIISDLHIHETFFQRMCSPVLNIEGISWVSSFFVLLPLIDKGFFSMAEVLRGGTGPHLFEPKRFGFGSLSNSFKADPKYWIFSAEMLMGRNGYNQDRFEIVDKKLSTGLIKQSMIEKS